MRQKQLRTKLNKVVKTRAPINIALKGVSLLIGVVVVYTVVQSEVWFRLFVVLFLLGTAFVLNKKVNELKVNAKEEDVSPAIEMENQHTRIFEKTVTEKEEQLEKIDLDRTQLLEELFSKAELDEREKQTYRERIKQKESERSSIMQDLMIVKGKLQQAVYETKKYFVKTDPMKELAATIEAENIEEASIVMLNKKVKAVISSTLSENTIEALVKGNYVDEDYNLTRSGYKALLKTMQKDSE
ncbi:hypothetical protein [Halalkalibacter alkalisediminis]|uniref:Uncharacterized protein n=1 Tax=Halalkalibacter alkalisediminis TaxID=935616 RepID=A0ABV6NI18_9BACI|nr:hypothetical protein [Halalkalibacter alkalisediminis]